MKAGHADFVGEASDFPITKLVMNKPTNPTTNRITYATTTGSVAPSKEATASSKVRCPSP